ncbi:hypothetical protein Dsin_009164 [Dipteronia sinensis]|uniref:LAGLIDADG homing endonuclease n=1 Tax=Dipteronia sinensis TaxID=43782 RepID=A0AAE0AR97_9ROSI|nr:hypothetical protein Dsin_009164 [Dipteronia sinensis]
MLECLNSSKKKKMMLMIILLGMSIVEGERLDIKNCGPRRGGFVPGHAVIDRDRAEGHNRIYRYYFVETPKYSLKKFRRRFRMRRPLFFRIQSAVENYEPYFVQRMDCSGRMGLSSIQKITTLRMLAYGASSYYVDD